MDLNKYQLQVGNKKVDNELVCKGLFVIGLTAVLTVGAYIVTKKVSK